MSVIRDVKNVKIKHGDDVVLVKSGNFYRCYDKDSYIISYIMNYQVKQATANNYMCGFPVNSLDKVIETMQNLNINYRIIDFKREDKTVVEECNFGLKNSYEKIYMKAYKYINIKRRIEEVCECLINNIEKEETLENIDEIEKTVYETFK